MHRPAHKLTDGEILTADVCIVGAGAAGIVLARAMADAGRTVLLVEAGGLKGGRKAQTLYSGVSDDIERHQTPDTDRCRGLGGSSAMWGGRCMPYDSQDFEARSHIAGSGWPFGRETLDPYYERAQAEAEAGRWAYDAASAGLPDEMISGAQTDVLRLDTLERWSPPTHFGKRDRDILVAHPKITLVTEAVAVQLETHGERVDAVQLRALRNGRKITARAAQVVLAGGGLEVPRLLMHSPTTAGHAIGDHSGWLGRGYMSHVGGVIARLILTPGRNVIFGYEQDADGVYVRRRVTLSAQAQADHGLPNMYALLDRPLLEDADHESAILSLAFLAKRLVQRQTSTEADKGGTFALYKRHLRNLIFGAPEVLSVLPRFGRKRFLSGRRVPSLLLKSKDNSFYLYFHAEQSAVPEARITLDDSRDALGMQRLRIAPHLTDQDAEGILRAHRLIGAELERTGSGKLAFLNDDPMADLQTMKFTLGHHIGATRMAARAEDGVVDANARVYGTDNLFIASASVLPTSSQAHPTLTVLAMALRLADHLATMDAQVGVADG